MCGSGIMDYVDGQGPRVEFGMGFGKVDKVDGNDREGVELQVVRFKGALTWVELENEIIRRFS